MVRLEFEQRQFLNICIARARAFEQQRMAAEFRTQMEQERQAMQAQFERVREKINADWAELRRQLDDTRAELARLQALHTDARERRAE